MAKFVITAKDGEWELSYQSDGLFQPSCRLTRHFIECDGWGPISPADGLMRPDRCKEVKQVPQHFVLNAWMMWAIHDLIEQFQPPRPAVAPGSTDDLEERLTNV